MRKLLFPVVMAVCGALLFTACTNDDETGVAGDDLLREYTANFEKMFGPVNPAQNFNTQRTVTIDASMANAQGSYTLRVYDGHPGNGGTSLLGKFENLSAGSTSTVKVGAIKSVENLYFVADDGTTRSLTSSPISDAGHVTARFDATTGTAGETEFTDEPTTVFIAFEDLGSTDDFDFNDVVIRVDYVTGTGEADVTLMAVGASFSLKLFYAVSGNDLTPLFEGRELHDVMGHLYKIINTNWPNPLGTGWNGVDNVPFVTRTIRVPQDFYIGEDGAPFVLEVNGTKGQVRISSLSQYGMAPQVLVVGEYYNPTDCKGYYFRWPKERVNIINTYHNITNWMNDPADVSWLFNAVDQNRVYNGYDPTVGHFGLSPASLTVEERYEGSVNVRNVDPYSSQLTMNVEGDGVIDATLSYSSIKFTALVPGTATITVTDGATGETATSVVTVNRSLSRPQEGLEAVDLGLPSGTLWANMNIGATAPEDHGRYFSWGDTKNKTYFSSSGYPYFHGSYFEKIGDDIAGTEYDTATFWWGSDWQMPSSEQCRELIRNTTSTWVTQNGVQGRLFTSNQEGNTNSIFLPVSGYYYNGVSEKFRNPGEGYYWTSTFYTGSESISGWERNGWAYNMHIYSSYADWSNSKNRYYGLVIRPIKKGN